ncbi:MAG: hypothetical protein H6Q90_1561 [Deltaproteobacteria bacterium]|nr:hypothetical protein [Deltaproteobacteria bacterium]
MSIAAEVLAEVPMFAGLDEADRAVLAERVDIVDLEAGTLLFSYGDPGDYMMILLSGRVEISVKTKTGNQVFLELVEPREFFGEISLLDMGPRTASAKVAESGQAVVVDRGDLDELLRLRPTAALQLLIAAGKRMRTTAQTLRNTASQNVNIQVEVAESGMVLRIADWVANFSGSITFLVFHLAIFTVWIGFNVGVLPVGNFDPFPFGLLTMIVSLEAIILSTLLLFSSNRQTARDRIRGEIEYDVNLKAELQIQHLHEKLDQMNAQVLGRLDALEPHRRVPGTASRNTPH